MEKEEENAIKKAEINAKINSLETDLVSLKSSMFYSRTALNTGYYNMEQSLKNKLIDLNKELKSLNHGKESENGK